MARQDKYYGTYTMLAGNELIKIKELGYKGHHSQFRVVCKAKSLAEANRIAEGMGLGKNVFQRDYTSETGNDTEIKKSDEHGFIINLGGTMGDNYIPITDIL